MIKFKNHLKIWVYRLNFFISFKNLAYHAEVLILLRLIQFIVLLIFKFFFVPIVYILDLHPFCVHPGDFFVFLQPKPGQTPWSIEDRSVSSCRLSYALTTISNKAFLTIQSNISKSTEMIIFLSSGTSAVCSHRRGIFKLVWTRLCPSRRHYISSVIFYFSTLTRNVLNIKKKWCMF